MSQFYEKPEKSDGEICSILFGLHQISSHLMCDALVSGSIVHVILGYLN